MEIHRELQTQVCVHRDFYNIHAAEAYTEIRHPRKSTAIEMNRNVLAGCISRMRHIMLATQSSLDSIVEDPPQGKGLTFRNQQPTKVDL